MRGRVIFWVSIVGNNIIGLLIVNGVKINTKNYSKFLEKAFRGGGIIYSEESLKSIFIKDTFCKVDYC